MENLKIPTKSSFYIDRVSKNKLIKYEAFRHHNKHNGYEFYNKYEKIKLGVQLCDFINTDFHSFDGMKNFIELYSPCIIANLGNVPIYRYYEDEEYTKLINSLIEKTAKTLKDIQALFKKDIEYIYNLNDLEELSEFSPAKRLYILRGRKEEMSISKLFEKYTADIQFTNYGDFNNIPLISENNVQEIASAIEEDRLLPHHYLCDNIVPTLYMELFELTMIDNIEIKRCKNCGKLFVPENRSDELYCSGIFENGRTCKEVGPFKFKQKLMEENNDLKIYRNVYQKLLLRTRR
ncbi:MAG: hypothetical protein HUJ68_08650, partial [Clostridia bacterium]|nr:hypothetical protein [Clostridia bacterium]